MMSTKCIRVYDHTNNTSIKGKLFCEINLDGTELFCVSNVHYKIKYMLDTIFLHTKRKTSAKKRTFFCTEKNRRWHV